MIILVLTFVVLAQIALFQFFAAWANRSVLLDETGRLGGPIPETVQIHARYAPVIRMTIGTSLAALLFLSHMTLDDHPLAAKLLIVGVSVVSAVYFIAGQSTDRRIMRELAETSPEGHIRRASLAKRDLGRWYHPALEAAPLVIFIATAVFVLNTSVPLFGNLGPGGHGRVLVYLSLQGAIVVAGLYRSLRPVAGAQSVARFLPSLRRNPEVSVRLNEELAVTQLRFAMAAKIGITSLLGARVVEHVLRAANSGAASFWGWSGWIVFAALMAAFSIYLWQVCRISREMQEQMNATTSTESRSSGHGPDALM